MTNKFGIVSQGKLLTKFRVESGNVLITRKGANLGGVEIDFPQLSRSHAQLVVSNDSRIYLVDLGSTNGSFVNGRKLEKDVLVEISERDEVRLGGENGILLIFNPDNYAQQSRPIISGQVESNGDLSALLARKNKILIGRGSECDFVLNIPTVSKQHASIEKIQDGSYLLKDLHSTNGTFVNGKRVSSGTKITEKDKVMIGRFILSIKGKAKNLLDEITVKADRIVKTYPGGYVGLKQTSFEIASKSLIGVMGPSGCGKSTLLKALCGDSPVTRGNVFLFGLELAQNYDFLKTQIGYVPQDDIVHRELTVEQSLWYAAKLRLADADNKFIQNKIDEVLRDLNITHIRNNLVKAISGGQRKRVSIAVEILTDPMILFLDEPTSPLDPQTIEEFLGILKNLSIKGTTVIMVTHKPDDLEFMDSVIFMAEGGHIAYHDSVDRYKSYFNVNKTREVYACLEQPKAEVWIKKFANDKNTESTGGTSPQIKGSPSVNFFKQYYWLTLRYFNIKFNDKWNSLFLVAQAPIIAGLICLIFDEITQAVPFLMAISAIWFGTNNAAREIVSENAIYKRERMFNQGILPYIFSKITVLGSFTLIQTVLFITIITIAYSDSGSHLITWNNAGISLVWMFMVSISASLMGLFMSAGLASAEKVMTFVPIALIPQIMLAGVVAPIQNKVVEFLSYFTLARWGTEGFSINQEEVTQEHFVLKEGTGVMSESNPPEFIPPEMIKSDNDTVVNAIESLQNQFHPSYADQEIFAELTGTLKLDMLAISVLSFLFFIGIYVFLKKKDPLKIN